MGFAEPPPYVGKKRIFQADEFYDVSHPVRRALHIAYIKHCLANMVDRRNVVFSLGEEFTGPASFVRFWLETIAQWKRDNPRASPIICLGCTKDVQDEILGDDQLCELIQVIDLKYWWYTLTELCMRQREERTSRRVSSFESGRETRPVRYADRASDS